MLESIFMHLQSMSKPLHKKWKKNHDFVGCDGLEQKFPHKPNLDSIDLELQPILAIRSDIGNRNRYWMNWAEF